MQQILDWFKGLKPRERLLVAGGGIVVLIAALYFLALAPFYQAVGTRAERVAKKEADLAWMRSVAAEVAAGGSSGGSVNTAESLILLIDRTSKECGVGSALTGQTPRGDSGMSVRLEGAEFDKLVVCLGNWQQLHAVIVQEANFDRTPKAGVVNASLTLNRPPG